MSRPLVALAAIALLGPARDGAIDLADTRLVADPATSGTLVAFAYANAAPLFRRHVRIALGSAAETQRLLTIAAERGYLPAPAVTELLTLADRTIACLIGLLRRRAAALHHRSPTTG